MGVPQFALLIPLLGILATLIIVLAALWLRFRQRQLQHQERMAALERGVAVIPPAEAQAPWSPRVYLLRGLIWTFTGAALSIFLLGQGLASRHGRLADSADALFGLIPMGVGVAYLIYYRSEAAIRTPPAGS